MSCVCWLPPCEAFPEGLVITGSNDNTILGYNLQDGAVQMHLKGHENAVCSVTPGLDSGVLIRLVHDVIYSYSKNGKLISLGNNQTISFRKNGVFRLRPESVGSSEVR